MSGENVNIIKVWMVHLTVKWIFIVRLGRHPLPPIYWVISYCILISNKDKTNKDKKMMSGANLKIIKKHKEDTEMDYTY